METNTQLQKLNEVRTEIDTVLSETQNLIITNTKTYLGVRNARTRVQRVITDIETRRKELKAPILAAANLIDSTAKELTLDLEVRKGELIDSIKGYEEQKEKERLEKQLKETQRKLAITEKIQQYRDKYITWINDFTPVEKLLEISVSIEKDTFLKADYQEFLPQVKEERDLLLIMVQSQITAIREKELESARQDYRNYFESPECPLDSVEEIRRAIQTAEEEFMIVELIELRTEYLYLTGKECPETLSAEEIRGEIKKFREARFEEARILRENTERIEKENAEKLLLRPVTPEEAFPEVHATNEPIPIKVHLLDERAYETHVSAFMTYLNGISKAVDNIPTLELPEAIRFLESMKQEIREHLDRLSVEYHKTLYTHKNF